MSRNIRSRNPDLDGMRGIAIALVLYCHAGWQAGLPGALESWLGVDIFFVLSGYLITTILLGSLHREDYYRHFYTRRTLRIFPALYVALLIVFCAALVKHMAGGWKPWVVSGLFLTSVFIKYLTLHAGTVWAPTIEVMRSTWSVSIEELFYLGWAPAVRNIRSIRALALIPAAALIIEPAVRGFVHTKDYFEYWLFPCRLDGLALGALIAIFLQIATRHKEELKRLSRVLLVAMLVIDVPAFWMIGMNRVSLRFAVAGYSLIILTTGAVLFWLLVRSEENTLAQKFLRNRALTYLGRRSYMVYLMNEFFIIGLQRLFVIKMPDVRMPYLLGGFLGVVAVLIFAEISWRFMEGPLLATNTEQKIINHEVMSIR